MSCTDNCNRVLLARTSKRLTHCCTDSLILQRSGLARVTVVARSNYKIVKGEHIHRVLLVCKIKAA